MAEWKGIKMDAGRIFAETAKSVKISMPSKSEFKNYYFWHPKKLIFWTLKSNKKLSPLFYQATFLHQPKKSFHQIEITSSLHLLYSRSMWILCYLQTLLQFYLRLNVLNVMKWILENFHFKDCVLFKRWTSLQFRVLLKSLFDFIL